MSLFSNLLGNLGFDAASALPPLAVPKVRGGQTSYAPHSRSIEPSKAVLQPGDRRVAGTDLTTYRTLPTTKATIREFAATSPDLSAAKFAYLRVAITQGYKIKAFSPEGEFDEDATRMAYQLVTRMDVLPDYANQGFSTTPSVRSLAEAFGGELITDGACAAELVLNKQRIPERIQPISVTKLKFYEEGKALRPVQLVGSEEVNLDIPTFFYTSLDQNLTTAYADSPFEPAVQAVLADASFTNSLRRALQRVILPRLNVTMGYEAILKLIPPEDRADPARLVLALRALQKETETTVNGLNPEDALVNFDAIKYEYLKGGTGEASSLIDTIQRILNSKTSTGAKTLPSILGHSNGSQTLASSETLMFIKSADGAIRVKLNELFSRIFTLAVRLTGHDCYVRFEYDPIDLRPVNELEAFMAQKQSRILEQLSLGLITTAEACIDLTGRLPRKGYEELAGTMFKSNKPDPSGNMYSNNATGGGGNSTTGNSNQSDAPTNRRAGNKV